MAVPFFIFEETNGQTFLVKLKFPWEMKLLEARTNLFLIVPRIYIYSRFKSNLTFKMNMKMILLCIFQTSVSGFNFHYGTYISFKMKHYFEEHEDHLLNHRRLPLPNQRVPKVNKELVQMAKTQKLSTLTKDKMFLQVSFKNPKNSFLKKYF